jgi:chaperonin GroES
MKIRVIGDHVLVKLDRLDDTWGDSGLVRPDCAAEKPMWGEVMAVGPGAVEKRAGRSVFIATTLERGQRVMVPWGTGHDLKIDGRLHVQLSENQVLAVAE